MQQTELGIMIVGLFLVCWVSYHLLKQTLD